MQKTLTATVLTLALLTGLSGCQGNADRVADDPTIPAGTQMSWSGEFRLPDGATDPLSGVLLDPGVQDGAGFSVGAARYRKLGNGVGKQL